MNELPELSPEAFEILAVRELRKAGLEVGALRVHRRSTLPEPERGYLLELDGVVSGDRWRERLLIACRRQETPIGRAAVEEFAGHFAAAGVGSGILFGAPGFAPDALQAQPSRLVLLRVTDGRTAFDTSGWGAPGHYPAWLPAYCAQAVGRDPIGQARYQLLGAGMGEAIGKQLQAPDSTPHPN